MAFSSRIFRIFRVTIAGLTGLVLMLAAGAASADERLPTMRPPRSRLCCAFATHLPLHLGSSHIPIHLRQLASVPNLGRHSYTGWDHLGEGTGIVYTVRGGFIDLGHTRDFADLTAYLTVRLRPLLARGQGSVTLAPLLGARRVVVTKAVPPSLLSETTALVARRSSFELSIWSEIVQFYGRGKMRGAEEVYSAFTPEDLYSNLLGTYLGARAVSSDRLYDDAMTAELASALTWLGAVSSAETERTFNALSSQSLSSQSLSSRWWRRDVAWPSAEIAIARSFVIGPLLSPVRAPADVAPASPPGVDASPVSLEVPERNASGELLADFYRIEMDPDPENLPLFAGRGVITSADLPAIVAEVQATDAANKARAAKMASGAPAAPPEDAPSPLTHFVDGLRIADLTATGGVAADADQKHARGVGGGSFTAVMGDTRGGDFGFVRLDIGHTGERGLVSGVSLFRTDAVYFCHDPETGRLRAPLVSLLGPCKPSEWLGIGGSVGEALHDGRTGRTAIRPIGAYGVLNLLGNGQAASYRRVRFLLRGGGAIEHVWSAPERGVFIPRVGGKAIVLARSAGGHLEARGTTEYRIDPSRPEDAGFDSSAQIRWYFLLGGKDGDASGSVDGVDPWGVASLGVTGAYSYWSRPLHAFPDPTAPWVSTEHRTSFQLLLTATLGFEGLVF